MLNNKYMIKLLAVVVTATMFATPVTVFADGMREVDAVDEDRKEDLGDVKADGEKEDAVEIWADGHKADVTTGNLESADRNGLFTYAEHNAEIHADVNGDINTPAGISTERSASGVTTNALWGSKQDINVNGNIISGDDGITAKTSDRYEGDEPDAVEQGDYGDSRTDIKINGNITAAATGVEVTASNGGENHIEVVGDITGFKGGNDPERDDGAIWTSANNMDSRNDIVVKGDVTGDCIGAWMLIPYENCGNPENNIVIDGTLSAKNAAVLAENLSQAGKNTITVWKIETPGYTAVKWEYNEQDEENPFYLVEDEETEKNIQYIIRVNQNDNAALTATDAAGNALATVTGVGGSVLEYAYEGDKVLLKVDVADGYQIDAAYGDEGQQLELVRDANGNYYINVPRNGGVSFSVKLSKIEDGDRDNDNDADNNQEAGTFVLSDSEAISLISAAPAGGSVTISGIWETGLSSSVVAQLLARRDIDVTVTFMLNGMFYKIVIPAGADIARLIGADGSISFAALGQAFGIVPM